MEGSGAPTELTESGNGSLECSRGEGCANACRRGDRAAVERSGLAMREMEGVV